MCKEQSSYCGLSWDCPSLRPSAVSSETGAGRSRCGSCRRPADRPAGPGGSGGQSGPSTQSECTCEQQPETQQQAVGRPATRSWLPSRKQTEERFLTGLTAAAASPAGGRTGPGALHALGRRRPV